MVQEVNNRTRVQQIRKIVSFVLFIAAFLYLYTSPENFGPIFFILIGLGFFLSFVPVENLFIAEVVELDPNATAQTDKKPASEDPRFSTFENQHLKTLLAGNRRFVSGRLTQAQSSTSRRKELVSGQKPFAVILTCSDSRVPPEIIFDCGLGDIFVIRVAGNIIDDAVLGSIEFAVENLGVELVMVMGHSDCGAVAAALEGGNVSGHLGSIVKGIAMAVSRVSRKGKSRGDNVSNAVKAHVEMEVEILRSSQPVIGFLVKKNKVKVVGAFYDIASGKVELLD